MRNRWYDPELGRFITKDPMGYPDGPNGYAFVEGDPVNGRDPSGHYEEDVHDFMTRYLASAAGFDAVTATQIGQETVGLDFDERDAIIDNSPSPRNMRRYHFVSETRLRSMRDWALTSAAPLERIGEYLHALEDTYAHQSNPRHRDFGAQYHDAIVKGGVVLIRDAGHGLELHEPDWTWTRPELAMEMAADVYSELLRLCELRCAQQRYKTFDELRPTLWSFFTYQPTLYVDQFVAAGGFVQKDVPDVLTYRQKIAILDTKFAPERWEEEPGYSPSTIAAMLSFLVTSTLKPIASPPASVMRSTVFWTASRLMSQQATLAPSLANLRAVAWPMPCAAPVMMETFPESRMVVSSWVPRGWSRDARSSSQTDGL